MVTQQNNPEINDDGEVVPSQKDTDALFRKQNVNKVTETDVSEELRTSEARIGEEQLYSISAKFAIDNSSGANAPNPSGQMPCLVPFDCKVNQAYLVSEASGNVASSTTDENVFKLKYRRDNEDLFQELTTDGLKTSVTEQDALRALQIPGPFNSDLVKNGIVILEHSINGSGITTSEGIWQFVLLVSPI